MNCQTVTNLLDNRPSVDPTRGQEERLVGEHLLVCESCRSAWRASRMLRSFADTQTPSPRAALLEETMHLATTPSRRSRRPGKSFWLGGALGTALAASLTIVAFLVVYPPAGPGETDVSPGLAIALDETRDITLAINSAERLEDAQFHVVLNGGIELAGRLGQRDMRWSADINAGINRLRIPVTAVSSEDAELLVEVEHGSKRRRFLMQVDVVSSAGDESVTIG